VLAFALAQPAVACRRSEGQSAGDDASPAPGPERQSTSSPVRAARGRARQGFAPDEPPIRDILPAEPGFFVGWDPVSGKGRVAQRMPNGDAYVLCLQCRYPGYAGGLWIGSMSGSGLLWIPKRPPPGFRTLNIFCAQDESILDEDTAVEYDSGWSENFGRGDDGVRLDYVEGAVLEDGEAGDVVLRSTNRKDCIEVTRYLLWPRAAEHVVLSSTIRNVCDMTKRLAFWTGEDPWIGRYLSSDGDVGWYSGGLVPTEKSIDGAEFVHGGMYDLGNELLGQSSQPFSNAANFIALDPSLPKPSHVLFANAFAHDPAEIDPRRPLDNESLTALNIGWPGLRLDAGATVHFRYALGRAHTGASGTTPTVPEIPRAQWTFDRPYRRAATAEVVPGDAGPPIRFAEETIRLSVDPPYLHVDAEYVFENRSSTDRGTSMFYPFPIDDDHPYPDSIEVEGARHRPHRSGVIWVVRVPAQSTASVTVRYRQEARTAEARYILRSTHAWGEPLDRGTYEVSWPSGLRGVRVSYPGSRTEDGGRVHLRFERKKFMPDRDLIVKWTTGRAAQPPAL
jgi:hypothetical protein